MAWLLLWSVGRVRRVRRVKASVQNWRVRVLGTGRRAERWRLGLRMFMRHARGAEMLRARVAVAQWQRQCQAHATTVLHAALGRARQKLGMASVKRVLGGLWSRTVRQTFVAMQGNYRAYLRACEKAMEQRGVRGLQMLRRTLQTWIREECRRAVDAWRGRQRVDKERALAMLRMSRVMDTAVFLKLCFFTVAGRAHFSMRRCVQHMQQGAWEHAKGKAHVGLIRRSNEELRALEQQAQLALAQRMREVGMARLRHIMAALLQGSVWGH